MNKYIHVSLWKPQNHDCKTADFERGMCRLYKVSVFPSNGSALSLCHKQSTEPSTVTLHHTCTYIIMSSSYLCSSRFKLLMCHISQVTQIKVLSYPTFYQINILWKSKFYNIQNYDMQCTKSKILSNPELYTIQFY